MPQADPTEPTSSRRKGEGAKTNISQRAESFMKNDVRGEIRTSDVDCAKKPRRARW